MATGMREVTNKGKGESITKERPRISTWCRLTVLVENQYSVLILNWSYSDGVRFECGLIAAVAGKQRLE